MARILVCADGFFRGFSPIGLEPYIESFINTLVRNGNDVLTFIGNDFCTTKTWKKKIFRYQNAKEIKAFNPELILTFNNALDVRIVKKLDCPIFIIASDKPTYWSNKDFIKKYKDRYSVLFFNNDMSTELKQEYNIPFSRQILIPYSTDIHFDKNQKQTMDISFLGNFYNPSFECPNALFLNFNKLEVSKLENLHDLVIEFFDLLLLHHDCNAATLNCYKKIISITKIDIGYYAFVSEALTALTQSIRQEYLRSISDLDLHIFCWSGNFKSLSNNYSLFKKCRYQQIYTTEDNANVYNSSKISLNLPHAQVNTGFSWRVCDILASNALLLSNPSDDLTRLFSGIIPTFKTEKELRDKSLYFLKQENERKEIVKMCHKIIDDHHRYEHVFQVIEEYANIRLLNDHNGYLYELPRTRRKKEKYLKKREN